MCTSVKQAHCNVFAMLTLSGTVLREIPQEHFNNMASGVDLIRLPYKQIFSRDINFAVFMGN